MGDALGESLTPLGTAPTPPHLPSSKESASPAVSPSFSTAGQWGGEKVPALLLDGSWVWLDQVILRAQGCR